MLVEKMRALQLIESFVYKLKLDVKEIMTRVSVTWSWKKWIFFFRNFWIKYSKKKKEKSKLPYVRSI